MNVNIQQKRPKRRGVLSMELLLTLPIFATLLLGLFEFSLLFFARGDVVEASRVGARQASIQGASIEDVEAAVMHSLGPRMSSRASIHAVLGDYSGDEVIVGVRVPMSSASPNLLWPIGFNLHGRHLYCQTRMVKE
ncbi:TadE-like protein [Maioricimonas rarisocia]|uniref:TadE-like protein n=1 Tax=Maioricimonas rarisocia TaxID=2528026 RepID=A0A517ZFV7_9PLAN|nr:TadE/TadG family type IV pilus assembly protein [Maioricimonas rarisocia]QDU41344.1 TadE-like protein [Maioricimonas rarisocia]